MTDEVLWQKISEISGKGKRVIRKAIGRVAAANSGGPKRTSMLYFDRKRTSNQCTE